MAYEISQYISPSCGLIVSKTPSFFEIVSDPNVGGWIKRLGALAAQSTYNANC